jgi:hypothetical protein
MNDRVLIGKTWVIIVGVVVQIVVLYRFSKWMSLVWQICIRHSANHYGLV